MDCRTHSGGAEPIRFGVQDPRILEVSAEEGKGPLAHAFQPTVSWELVVPLYRDSVDLKVQKINIYNQQNQQVFSVSVDQLR